MSEMTDRVARAIEQRFKDRVAKLASRPESDFFPTFKDTGVIAPSFELWQDYARAAVEALGLQEETFDPYVWTKIWWDAESGTIRREQIPIEDVKL